jgi:membrane associated rhomboid family serine protease
MTPELLVLLAASMVGLQIFSLFMRREARGEAPYVALLTADLALLLFVNYTHRFVSPISFVALGVAGVLVLAPWLLDGMERSALERDQIARAARIAGVRELLVPGRTTRRRHRYLRDLAWARDGRAGEVLARLRDELRDARSGNEALQLREELATVLFLEQRFDECVAEVEAHLGAPYIAEHPVLATHLVRAYCELGQLEKAGETLTLLEQGPASRDPQAAMLLLQARIVFLAFAGERERVDGLLAGPLGRILPERAQALLRQVARSRVAPESPSLRAIAERAAGEAGRAFAPVRARKTPVTFTLVALNFAAFACMVFLLHNGDDAAMVRAGALFRPAVEAGEWWRLFTAMFLHAGAIHLLLNMYGLFLLGRFVEDVFGPARYLLVYLGSGLVGGLSSTLVSPGSLSVGASGAIMGLVGALIVALLLKRGHWPEAWRRRLLTTMLVLSAMQIFIGFQVPNIDNAAHVGGLVGGAALTLFAAPVGLIGDRAAGRWIARILAALLCAATLAAGFFDARTSIDATLRRIPTHTVAIGGAELDVPSYWEEDAKQNRLEDPFLGIVVTVESGGKLDSPQADDPRFRPLLQRIERSVRMKP